MATELLAHMGVGANSIPERVEVRWPDIAHAVETFKKTCTSSWRCATTRGTAAWAQWRSTRTGSVNP